MLPNFKGGKDATTAYRLAEGSALIGAGVKVDDELTVDFFGNEITRANIGCYGGSGEKVKIDILLSKNVDFWCERRDLKVAVFKK